MHRPTLAMRTCRTAAVMAVLVLAAPSAGAGADPAPKADKPEVICVKEAETGSHIRRRTCMTRAQHEERRKRDQEAMERMKGPVQPNEIGR